MQLHNRWLPNEQCDLRDYERVRIMRRGKWFVVALALLIAFAAMQCAHAEVNLPVICTGVPVQTTCAPRKYDAAAADSWVDVGSGWKRFSALADTDKLRVTANNVAKGTAFADLSTVFVYKPLAVSVAPAATDTSPFSASILSGQSPLTTVLTWDVAGVTSCTASGSWTGSKPVNGTQTIPGLTASAKYTLTCIGAQQLGTASLSWQLPTQNTDNSALTDLAGTRILYGLSADALTSIVQVPVPGAAYQVDRLTPGQTYYFAVKAYTAGGAESALSATVNKSITGTPGEIWTRSLDVVVLPPPTIPNPPTGLTVSEPTAYRLDQQANKPLLVAIGTVPLRTVCVEADRILGKYRVDRSLVKMASGRTRPNVALATCATS